ncbi:hypothetical protein EDS67_14585 [candidate division KSB1 bacterium]|nr:MAG: hypothetical protein EDS67_14585 [candidate division KSB1 bacterium]MBC6949288.1 hypothetical protein [candidate division KSB1 bacterium]MCE7941001.1 hypothetical protein [Chlorobi bacterium CHB1]RIK60519.1 MAG: hypothetical protein DCC62_28120 [candidate division KSB1 bacterium]
MGFAANRFYSIFSIARTGIVAFLSGYCCKREFIGFNNCSRTAKATNLFIQLKSAKIFYGY